MVEQNGSHHWHTVHSESLVQLFVPLPAAIEQVLPLQAMCFPEHSEESVQTLVPAPAIGTQTALRQIECVAAEHWPQVLVPEKVQRPLALQSESAEQQGPSVVVVNNEFAPQVWDCSEISVGERDRW